MIKRVPIILMIIAPYVFLLALFFVVKSNGLFTSLTLIIYSTFLVLFYLPNMVYAFILLKRGEEAKFLLFWDMILKLFNIPVYILVFFTWLALAIHAIGIFLSPIFILFDYLLLLPSTMYGISGLIQARKVGTITNKAAVINIIMHFIFCLDVISAIIMFIKVRKRKEIEI